jgi:hypothetical protein
MTRELVLLPILRYLKGNVKELNKVYNFVRKCDFFRGRRRAAYKLIIKYKKAGGGK